MTINEFKNAFKSGRPVVCATEKEYDRFAVLATEWGYKWINGDQLNEWSPFMELSVTEPTMPIVIDTPFKDKRLYRDADVCNPIMFSEVTERNITVTITYNDDITIGEIVENGKKTKIAGVRRFCGDVPDIRVAYEELGKKLFCGLYRGYDVIKKRARVGDHIIIRDNPGMVVGCKAGDIIYIDGESQKPTPSGFIWGCGASYEAGNYYVLLNYTSKPTFRPIIRYSTMFGCSSLGFIGDKTPIRDIVGELLCIGDTVELIDLENKKFIGERPICKNEISGFFILGVPSSKFDNGVSGNWIIRKKRSFSEIKHNEAINLVEYILKQED